MKILMTVTGLFLSVAGMGYATVCDAADPATAIAGCYAGTSTCIIDLQGATYTLTTGLIVDPLKVTMRDGTLDCTQLAAGAACITISTDQETVSNYGTAAHYLKGLRLIGNTSADGILFNSVNDDNILVASITVENTAISGFRRGISMENHAYDIGFSHIQVWGNTVGVYTMAGANDAGERITFTDSTIFNNTTGYDDEGAFETNWLGSRWDYNTKTAIISGYVYFDGRLETSPGTGTVVDLHGGSLIFSLGSFILMNNPSGDVAVLDYWASGWNTWNTIVMPSKVWGVRGTKGVMNGGTAQTYTLGTYSPS